MQLTTFKSFSISIHMHLSQNIGVIQMVNLKGIIQNFWTLIIVLHTKGNCSGLIAIATIVYQMHSPCYTGRIVFKLIKGQTYAIPLLCSSKCIDQPCISCKLKKLLSCTQLRHRHTVALALSLANYWWLRNHILIIYQQKL